MARGLAGAATETSPPRRKRRATHTPVASYRNSRGELLRPSAMTASEAKSEFGRVLETALRDGAVVITRHDAPRAVLISIEDFNALSGGAAAQLDVLDREFDELLDRMQLPRARQGMRKAFAASARELGKSAAAALKRGK